MRSAIAAGIAATVTLLAASVLGVASAEAPVTPPQRTIGVEGVAQLAIGQSDSAAAATAVYRQAMAAAIADGQSKAEFLASKVGAALGSVQSVVEGGGYIGCFSDEPEQSAEYEGEQPDFGSGPTTAVPATAAPSVAAIHVTAHPKPKKRRSKHPVAKRAGAVSCTLSAQVSLVYAIS
jgi:uncharacterized protein DUF541